MKATVLTATLNSDSSYTFNKSQTEFDYVDVWFSYSPITGGYVRFYTGKTKSYCYQDYTYTDVSFGYSTFIADGWRTVHLTLQYYDKTLKRNSDQWLLAESTVCKTTDSTNHAIGDVDMYTTSYSTTETSNFRVTAAIGYEIV